MKTQNQNFIFEFEKFIIWTFDIVTKLFVSLTIIIKYSCYTNLNDFM